MLPFLLSSPGGYFSCDARKAAFRGSTALFLASIPLAWITSIPHQLFYKVEKDVLHG